jgi:hypothetical protein
LLLLLLPMLVVVYPRTVLLLLYLQTLLPEAHAAEVRRCLSFRHRRLQK